MKKENFISLILGVVSVLIFGLGMNMVMQWNTFQEGVIVGIVGIILFILMIIIRRKMLNKPAIQIHIKSLLKILFVIFALLVLGTGMCMTMVWDGLFIQGIIVGIIGIILLLCLIPLYRGIH